MRDRSILVELNKDTPSHVLYGDINAALAGISSSQLEVTLVGLCVTFDPLPDQTEPLVELRVPIVG